jgi:hypothetical protein
LDERLAFRWKQRSQAKHRDRYVNASNPQRMLLIIKLVWRQLVDTRSQCLDAGQAFVRHLALEGMPSATVCKIVTSGLSGRLPNQLRDCRMWNADNKWDDSDATQQGVRDALPIEKDQPKYEDRRTQGCNNLMRARGCVQSGCPRRFTWVEQASSDRSSRTVENI